MGWVWWQGLSWAVERSGSGVSELERVPDWMAGRTGSVAQETDPVSG